MSVVYTQQEHARCKWPPGRSGERFHSLEEAKTGCHELPGCTMVYERSGSFYTCPVGSTIESLGGYTLYTAIGKLS